MIAQGLNLKLSPEQVKVIEQEIRDDPNGQWGKLSKYFENITPTPKREAQSKTPGGGSQHKAHQEIFKGPNGSKALGFDNCPDMQAYFKTMCEEDTIAQIKFARLRSPALQAQLQDRYCAQVGERIFKFLENEFHSLCGVFYRGQDGFLDIHGTLHSQVKPEWLCMWQAQRKWKGGTGIPKKFIETLNHAIDQQDVRDYVLASFGNALAGDPLNAQRALLLVGIGGSGKSTILDAVSNVV